MQARLKPSHSPPPTHTLTAQAGSLEAITPFPLAVFLSLLDFCSQVQLFARKFSGGVLQNLLDLKYLEE